MADHRADGGGSGRRSTDITPFVISSSSPAQRSMPRVEMHRLLQYYGPANVVIFLLCPSFYPTALIRYCGTTKGITCCTRQHWMGMSTS